ncbi:3' terminal RNA ribose 2'-O-methyltransferase Hen1 [Cellulomonas uda]|uniref:Small RNA 2'-O-methyltransferase n=1 Tax=Cellulomonas uda TaxID=1714 RepID=A0A4Y3K6U7_CELUD|nr:3' terminal RNA ribose 2'-O-methyltransferase Hen1 [Cellulomonas uda]NII65182.1 3' terminal RNA ribose 2'-O-methyltransferase Hen1 [Cellulomonas uda]GEA80229.1 3' terminal RNA ribose 2'-O-methyltransferase Hen1 [Cellulomonas uda]
MLLTLTTTRPDDATPASDLGYLLHKHPARVQTFDSGTVHVLYPEADDERCTVAVLLEVDPVALVRGTGRREPFVLAQYVNDRPYTASSQLVVAMGRVFRSALTGRCDARPDLVDRRWPLEVHVPVVGCTGGPEAAQRLLAPLGWEVEATPLPLDPQVPAWGDSRYVDLRLRGTHRVADALSHLYVLLPALDGTKHYWVDEGEVDKLLRAGGDWLAVHPARDEIARRYLARSRALATFALDRLAEVEGVAPFEATDDDAASPSGGAAAPEPSADVPLVRQRHEAVLAALRASDARTVVDLGCGEGAFVGRLLDEGYARVVGTDVSVRALTTAARRLHLDTMPERVRARVDLVQSSVTYTDARIAGFDAAVLMEVVEHLDPPRLAAMERVVLGVARPRTLVVTTPNAEHNVRYPALAAGGVRHDDHRFEWTRAQFRTWAQRSAGAHGYTVSFAPVGPDDPDVGPPTQLAVFRRQAQPTTGAGPEVRSDGTTSDPTTRATNDATTRTTSNPTSTEGDR